MRKWIAGIVILSVVGLWANSEMSSYNSTSIKTMSTILLPQSKKKLDFSLSKIQPINLTYAVGQLAPIDKEKIDLKLEPIIAHLKDHNHKVINIIGGHIAEEAKISVGGFSNFGEARAGYIKRELVNANIARSRISIHGQLMTSHPKQFPIQVQINLDPELDN